MLSHVSHDAQPCYCGEPNCVGFIGGKTQTDLAAMDDLYLDGVYFTDVFVYTYSRRMQPLVSPMRSRSSV